MNSWNKRTREVAYLLNPAFCGRMLYSAINAYSIKTKRAFPFPLVYLVLPLVLHKENKSEYKQPNAITPMGSTASSVIDRFSATNN